MQQLRSSSHWVRGSACSLPSPATTRFITTATSEDFSGTHLNATSGPFPPSHNYSSAEILNPSNLFRTIRTFVSRNILVSIHLYRWNNNLIISQRFQYSSLTSLNTFKDEYCLTNCRLPATQTSPFSLSEMLWSPAL